MILFYSAKEKGGKIYGDIVKDKEDFQFLYIFCKIQEISDLNQSLFSLKIKGHWLLSHKTSKPTQQACLRFMLPNDILEFFLYKSQYDGTEKV